LNDLLDIVITPDVIRDSIAHLKLMMSDTVHIMSLMRSFNWNSFLHPYIYCLFLSWTCTSCFPRCYCSTYSQRCG